MIPVIRKSVIFVLAMLQLFVPLVHAHTGAKNFNQGLHVPGLELYHISHDAPVTQNVNVDWDSEGLLVVVDTGIKTQKNMMVVMQDGPFALSPADQWQVTALPESDNNFSPQTQSFSFRKFPVAYSPRAPPAQ
jgi:hypothetical protein